MNHIPDIETYGPRWQCIVMLLAALNEIRGGGTKAEIIDYIRDQHWFDIQPEDRLPYPSNRYTSKEARWITVIAWARKDSVERNLMHKGSFNDWQLTTEGLNAFSQIAKACREGLANVSRCYLWSRDFKRRMNPAYQCSDADSRRPMNLYDDWVVRTDL